MIRSYRRPTVALPTWYRWLLITASTLILCSCRSMGPTSPALPSGSADREVAPVSESTANATRPPSAVAARLSDGGPVRQTSRPVQTVAHQQPLDTERHSVMAGPAGEAASSPAAGPMGAASPAPNAAPYVGPNPAVLGNVTPHGAYAPGTPLLPPHLAVRPHAPLPWAPPNIGRPWPENEYLCDGGDRLLEVQVSPDWTIHGLDQEDTVAHFDTLDGRTEVTASNRVCIYAPRFASVRKVTGLIQHQQHQRSAGVENPQRLASEQELGVASTYIQPLQPGRNLAHKSPHIFQDKSEGIEFSKAQRLYGLTTDLLPFEDFEMVRNGTYLNSEKLRLSEYIAAAFTWAADQAVQVVIDETTAHVATGDEKPQETRLYEMPKGKPRVRICKLASRSSALPGDEVAFTLRFDNVGDQVVGNVTIVDNLTTRLEYIEGSAECSVKADFFAVENEGDSLILRWEIIDPLEVGEGGVIRFKCRVR